MTRARLRIVVAASGACFLALALAIALAGTPPGDAAVRDALLALAAPPVVAAMRVVNHAGSWGLLLPAVVLLVLAYRPARARWWAWLGLMVVAPLVEGALKVAVGRGCAGGRGWG